MPALRRSFTMALYAFNGTWNSDKTDDVATPENEGARNTNVVLFRNAHGAPAPYYCNGVGTRIGVFGKIFGGAFGVGGQQRLAEALAHLQRRFNSGDREIDIIGFSRGAALALAFANRIAKQVKDERGRSARVRFLGLFDVVGSFGIPFNLGPLKFQEYNLGYELALPSNVEYCYHAMALDEPRQTFRVTRVRGAYEVWFRGAHSDIGGGNGNAGLNAIARCWMLRKAIACGVPILESHVLDAAATCDATCAVHFAGFDPVRNSFRHVESGDRVHHTVEIPCGRTDWHDPPARCPREDVPSELIAARTALFQG
jgi:pimeloyl-ACP methyl ester carboxylesterase